MWISFQSGDNEQKMTKKPLGDRPNDGSDGPCELTAKYGQCLCRAERMGRLRDPFNLLLLEYLS
jgi:hypothetical protein